MGYVIYRFDPLSEGVIAHIVSNFNDLGIVNEKRISRCYLDVESEYSTRGSVSIEPDYYVRSHTHVDGETAEPSGSVSRLDFCHSGYKTWNTTFDFDSTVEAWNRFRLDIGTQGQAFRYSIRIGNTPASQHGTLRIKPPVFLVQVKSQR